MKIAKDGRKSASTASWLPWPNTPTMISPTVMMTAGTAIAHAR
jgi:hypothetical protein